MKKVLVTLVMALALVGLVGLGASMAATPHKWKSFVCEPGYAHYIGAPGSCSVTSPVGAHTPSNMGAVGF